MTLGIIAVSYGQEEKSKEMKTIFGNTDHRISHGGYAALSVGYTQIDGEDVMTLGGRAGWLIDHHVTIGLAGKAFMNSVFIEGDFPNITENGLYLSGGYGGFFVEPIVAPNFPVHVSFPILIGGGGLVLNDQTWHDYNWENDYDEPYDWDSYFVVEPGVEIELNVIKCFRVAFGASYRYTSNLHMAYVPKNLMNGFNGSVTFKFGKF
ncbi:MAG: hypothetical protein M0Q51_04970 [Bacteroidales bacterium]|nr:hypothetical protein [Bacteroidales bacterium]